jgi:hypothetical protein
MASPVARRPWLVVPRDDTIDGPTPPNVKVASTCFGPVVV